MGSESIFRSRSRGLPRKIDSDPILRAPYRAPWWLPGGHAQTVYAALAAPRPRVAYRRERWDTPDGDFIDLDWVQDQDRGSRIQDRGLREESRRRKGKGKKEKGKADSIESRLTNHDSRR